jgi:hypothetical protein
MEFIVRKIITFTHGDKTLRLTEKEMEVLVMHHPLSDNMTYAEIAEWLDLSPAAVSTRFRTLYKRNPWIEEEIKEAKARDAEKRRGLRNSIRRMGDMSCISANSEGEETFLGQKVIRKF